MPQTEVALPACRNCIVYAPFLLTMIQYLFLCHTHTYSDPTKSQTINTIEKNLNKDSEFFVRLRRGKKRRRRKKKKTMMRFPLKIRSHNKIPKSLWGKKRRRTKALFSILAYLATYRIDKVLATELKVSCKRLICCMR